MDRQHIRNFCIIAHIDHGKSTLADRFLEVTNTLEKREMKRGQMLDTMDIEQERGITIKLQPVRMSWKGHQLNLIDTPGHVDFSYEVSRSLAAVDGALLVVDASQGIEAQTLTTLYMALEHDLTIIPVLNKIDLPAADPERVAKEIENIIGIPADQIIHVSAKNGTNVDAVLDAVIERLPCPSEGKEPDQMKALIFDSVFDQYRGVVSYVRVMEGSIKRGDKVHLLNSGSSFDVLEVGCFSPKYLPTPTLSEGETGYIVTGLKTTSDARVGDTVWRHNKGTPPEEVHPESLPGYAKAKPFVFATIFPLDAADYPLLRDALEKYILSDSALEYEVAHSHALGHGYRCGFLGLLHMEIVQERLEREYNLDLIVTSPSVPYKLELMTRKGADPHLFDEEGFYWVTNPAQMPDRGIIAEIYEPYVTVEIVTPNSYVGSVMELAQRNRGLQTGMEYITPERVLLRYHMPLMEIVVDFYDHLKSTTSGYASMNYDFLDYRPGDLVKLDVMVAGEVVDSLALIVHRQNAESQGRVVCAKLKELIPKQLFTIAIQAAIGAKVIARETISAMRKDVTAKLYGGDISRKMKLLKKQKEGKKRMKQMGKVSIPQEAFLSILKKE
ncbi:elongation factor 4 [Candidatus Gracilibacteria bacterium CG17_big_fil_post_rev_8_21_14_2_50_48_13]|nr:MAG: elongation factor 4 [Candidatus Gracilibacteria bacterium CG17_big_fil_post_rev_8_21_14_2_50_48_13]